MCEEVQQPSTQVPKAIVGTVVLNTLAGLLFLIPLVFVLPDVLELIALPSGQPIPTIIKLAVGSSGGAFALLIPLLVLAIFCGIGCTTAASRCTWAFARDGAIPGSKWWKQVNHKLDVPLNAMMLSMVVQILLGLIYFGSVAAFNAFSGVGVICLTVSYATPIAVSLLGGRKEIKNGHFNWGVVGMVCNIIAICEHLPSHPPYCCLCSGNANHFIHRLELTRNSALLYAIIHPCHSDHNELRQRSLRRFCCYLVRLVLHLGP